MEEQVTLEPELEEALAHATDAEMCDIAGGQLWAVELGGSGAKVVNMAWDEWDVDVLRKPQIVVFNFCLYVYTHF